jgi:hypothetical protein
MVKAKFDIKTEATRPLYAGVGVTDLAVEAVRDYVADVQKTVTKIDFQPQALRKDARAGRAVIEARVAELQAEAKRLPTAVQALVKENVATVSDAYADLAKRGQVLVGRIRKQEATKATVKSAKTTSAKAKTTKTQAGKTAKSTSKKTTAGARATAKRATTTAKKSSAPSSAKATTTAAKKTASNATAAVSAAAQKVGD